MILTHLGAEKTVTGSCHLLQIKGLNILVDCGLAQGKDNVLPMKEWPVSPSRIHYLFLTHAHIDHIGRVPELIQKGFRGEILTTYATKALFAPMLRDSMSLQNIGEDQATKILKTVDDLSWGFEYNKPFDLKRRIRFTLGQAGHILGSCFIHFEWDSYSVVFSGDLGACKTPFIPDPDAPPSCDLLVLESTYGDRCHEDRTERIRRLGEALNHALSDGGKVFIPAFALGRVQEMIYEMDRLFTDPESACCIPQSEIQKSKVPVFLDSPLGLQITEITSRLSQYWDKEAREIFSQGDHLLDFDHLYAVKSYNEHLKLLEIRGPAIIVAGSGMCTGGRIMDHLTLGLKEPRNDIFFVGYQVKGTPGRDIIQYGRKQGGYVYLDGERVSIKAKVHALTGYSAHADSRELIDWVQSMPEKPARIKLVHGDFAARKALAEQLQELGYPIADFR